MNNDEKAKASQLDTDQMETVSGGAPWLNIDSVNPGYGISDEEHIDSQSTQRLPIVFLR